MIEVLRKEEGEFERSTCMGCVVSNRRVETAIALYILIQIKLPFLMKAYHGHKDDFSSHSCSGVRATDIMLGKPPGVTTTNTSGMEQKENQAAVGS